MVAQGTIFSAFVALKLVGAVFWSWISINNFFECRLKKKPTNYWHSFLIFWSAVTWSSTYSMDSRFWCITFSFLFSPDVNVDDTEEIICSYIRLTQDNTFTPFWQLVFILDINAFLTWKKKFFIFLEHEIREELLKESLPLSEKHAGKCYSLDFYYNSSWRLTYSWNVCVSFSSYV